MADITSDLFDSLEEEDRSVDEEDSGQGIKRNLIEDFATPAKLSRHSVAHSREHMHVHLRVRPFTKKELEKGESQDCMEISHPSSLLMRAPKDSFTFKSSQRGLSSLTHRFTFSRIFGEDTSQKELFDETMLGTVKDFIDGQNCLVFTYGVTNAGKTYTIQGHPQDGGILPRSLDVIFNSLEGRLFPTNRIKPRFFCDVAKLDSHQQRVEDSVKESVLAMASGSSKQDMSQDSLMTDDNDESKISNYSTATEDSHSELSLHSVSDDVSVANVLDDLRCRIPDDTSVDVEAQGPLKFSVWVSFAEIYNEYVYDLLEAVPKGKKVRRQPLKFAEDKAGQIYIKGLKQICVQSADEAYKIVKIGQKNLSIAETKLNQCSSRSHCIFSVKILRVVDVENPHVARVSQLSFCDLAGSERYMRTQNTGDRLKEAGNINTSLLTLGKCIHTLRYNQNHPKCQPKIIPFRESKLTRLFRSFLVGKGKASMIVNVNQCASGFDETIQVLKFSAIAKQVTTVTSKLDNTWKLPSAGVAGRLAGSARDPRQSSVRGRVSVAWATPGPNGRDPSLDLSAVEESYLEDEEEEEEDYDEEEEDDGQRTPRNSQGQGKSGLLALVETLKKQLIEEKRRMMMMEFKIREEVCQEMSQQLVTMEEDYRDQLEKERVTTEELYEKRLEKFERSVMNSRKRAKVDNDDIEITSSLLQAEQVKSQRLEQTNEALQRDIGSLKEALEEAQDKMDSQAEIMAELQGLTEASKQALEQANTKLQSKNQTIEEMEASRQETCDEAAHQHQELSQQVASLTEKFNRTEDALGRAADRREESEDELAALREQHADQVARLRSEHEALQESFRASRAEAGRGEELASESADLRRQLLASSEQHAGAVSEYEAAIGELQSRLNESETTIRELRASLREAESTICSAEEKLHSSEAEACEQAATLKAKIVALTKEAEDLKESRATDSEKEQGQKETIQSLQRDIGSLKQALEEAQDKMDSQAEIMAELQGLTEASKQALEQANAKLQSKNQKIEEMEASLQEVDGAAAKLQDKLSQQVVSLSETLGQTEGALRKADNSCQEYEGRLAKLQEKHSVRVAQLESEYSALQTSFQAFRGESESDKELATKLSAAATESAGLRRQLRAASRENSDRLSESDAKIGELLASLKEAEAERRDLRRSLDEAEAERRALRESLEDSKVQRQDIQQSLKEAEAQRKELQQSLKEAKAQRQELQGSLEEAEAQKQDLRQRLDEAKAQRQELQGSLEEAEAQKQEHQRSLEEAEAQRQDRRQSLEEAEAQKRELQRSLEQAEAQRQELRKSLEEAEAQKRELQESLEQAEAQRQELQKSLQQAEAQRRDRRQSLEDAEAQKREHQRSLEEAEAQRQELQGSLEEAKAQRQELQGSLEEAEAQKRELQRSLEQAEAQRQELQKSLEQAEAQRRDRRQSLEDAEAQKRELQESLEQAEAQRQDLQQRLEEAVTTQRSSESETSEHAGELQAKIDSLNEEQESRAVDLEREAEQRKAALADLQTQHKKEVAGLQKDLKTSSKALVSLNIQVEREKQKTSDSEDRVRGLEERLKAANKKSADTEEVLADLQARLDQKQESNEEQAPASSPSPGPDKESPDLFQLSVKDQESFHQPGRRRTRLEMDLTPLQKKPVRKTRARKAKKRKSIETAEDDENGGGSKATEVPPTSSRSKRAALTKIGDLLQNSPLAKSATAIKSSSHLRPSAKRFVESASASASAHAATTPPKTPRGEATYVPSVTTEKKRKRRLLKTDISVPFETSPFGVMNTGESSKTDDSHNIVTRRLRSRNTRV